jgi:hypothetical protein
MGQFKFIEEVVGGGDQELPELGMDCSYCVVVLYCGSWRSA